MASILGAGDGVARAYVFDDSWEFKNQLRNRAAVDNAPFETTYVGPAERQEILSNLPWPSPRAQAYGEYAFRTAPTPMWDLAGVRALAHLCAASLRPSERTLFLDDDVRLRSSSYNGQRFAVDSGVVRDTVLHRPIDGSMVGATYVGRADLALSEHLIQSSREVRRGVYDSSNGQSANHWHGEPGISGAFLLTTSRTVASIPVPRCYNEDWVVITLAAFRGIGIARLATPVLHAGGASVVWDDAVASTQQVGQVVFRCLFDAASHVGLRSTSRLLSAALGRLAEEARHEVAMWEEVLRKWPTLGSDDLRDSQSLQRAGEQAIRDYLRTWSGWFELVRSPQTRSFMASYFGR